MDPQHLRLPRRQLLTGLGAAALSPGLLAQGADATPAPAPTLPKPGAAALTEDLDVLERSLRTLHPGLTRYLAPTDFDAGLRRLRAAWAQSAGNDDPAPRVLALSRLLASLRCGHTYTNFFNQRGAVKEAISIGPPRLPLHFTWVGTQAVVTAAHASVAQQVAPGAALLALNGRPMAALRAALLPLVRTDGNNAAGQAALLAPSGADELETWDVLHPLVFGSSRRYVLRLQEAGRVRTLEVEGIPHAERLRMVNAPLNEPSDANPPWPLSLRPDGSAVLTMPGWAMYRTRWDWRAYIGQVFERLQQEGVRHLVIDLRGNEGGLDCGDAILARLIDRPIEARLHDRLVRYRRVPASLNPYLDTWDDSFRDWGERVEPSGRPGFWRFKADVEASAANRIEPLGPRFTGAVSVLVDGSNHSATFRFLQLLRRHRLARLVGGPTGGNQRGLNGGAFFFLRLPGSGIALDVPLIGTFAREPNTPDAGLLPDVPVQASVADIAQGRDAVLARALRLG